MPQDMQVRFLGQEAPLEEGMATRSSSLAWRIPWTEEGWPSTVHSVRKELHTTERLNNDKNIFTDLPQLVTAKTGAKISSIRGRGTKIQNATQHGRNNINE